MVTRLDLGVKVLLRCRSLVARRSVCRVLLRCCRNRRCRTAFLGAILTLRRMSRVLARLTMVISLS